MLSFKPATMFSLSTAMILDKEANESNFKALLTQLTGLHLNHTEDIQQSTEKHFSAQDGARIGMMGGKHFEF